MMRQQQLSRCPFCKSHDVRVITIDTSVTTGNKDENVEGYGVYCDNCQANGPLVKMKDTIKAWNLVSRRLLVQAKP